MLDNFSKKVSKIGSKIGEGASSITGAASSKTKLEIKKKELKDTYAELGRLFYGANKENVPVEYSDLFEKIRLLEKDAEGLKEDIDKNMETFK